MVVKQDIIFMKKDYGLLLIAVEEDRIDLSSFPFSDNKKSRRFPDGCARVFCEVFAPSTV